MTAKLVRALWCHPFIRFGLVGGAGYVVNLGALALGTNLLHLPVEAALAFAIFVAMGFTWMGNRYLTFADRRAHGARAVAEEWARFVGANLVGAVVNYGVAIGLVHFAPGILANKYVAQACGVLAGLVFNFTLSKKMVFKGSR